MTQKEADEKLAAACKAALDNSPEITELMGMFGEAGILVEDLQVSAKLSFVKPMRPLASEPLPATSSEWLQKLFTLEDTREGTR